MKNLHFILEGKWMDGSRPKDLYRLYVSENPRDYIDHLIEGLSSNIGKVKNGCAELLSLLSEDHPSIVYPYLDVFIEGLGSKSAVVRWESVCTLGNLAYDDIEKKTPRLLPCLYPFLKDKSIVLQGHTVNAITKIAENYPEKADEVFNMLVSVVDLFPGNRVGFIIEALARMAGNEVVLPRIRGFIEDYIDSEVKVVARKARRTLKKLA
jgi:hypothetical protein